MRDGIIIAGNIILDLVKTIDVYPPRLSLTTIRDIRWAIGGAVCNCGVDLAKLEPRLPIQAVGFVGADEYGNFILSELERHPGIDVSMIGRRGKTSFTDVMTEATDGSRTFFTYRGADSLLTPADFDFRAMDGSLFHIGYIMLLDGMDAPDERYGTAMARVLHDAREAGLATSIDVVSEAGARFRKLVPPSLRYADYCTINENEATMVTGIPLRDGSGLLVRDNFRSACQALKGMGVSRWATIHAPEAAAGIDEAGEYAEIESLRLPAGFIRGTVGAGDAFTSGVLYAAHKGGNLRDGLELGTAMAACSLSEPGATEGVRDLAATMEFYRRMRTEEAARGNN